MLRQSRRIIYRICLAFTDRKPDNVNDLYQDIACKLWLGWSKFRKESDVTSWVYRVALNTAVSEQRKWRNKDRPVFVAIDESLCDSLAEESADQRLEHLYRLIDRLSKDEKKLIYLYFDRLPFAQIAVVAGISESAAKQHIYRIKQKIIKLHQKEMEN